MSISDEDLLTLRSFNWQKIISIGKSLDDLNERQLRFARGLAIELATEHFCGTKHFVYVGDREAHKDFDWGDKSVEEKTLCTFEMYTKKLKLRKTFNIKLNNSNGTNKSALNPDHVADYIIVVYSDGAFLIDKETAIKNAKYQGDGFMISINSSEITEITGPMKGIKTVDLDLKNKIINCIKDAISSIDI